MSLPETDTLLFYLINRDLPNAFLDRVMPFVTSHVFLVFLPLVILLAVKEKRKLVPALATGLVAVALADAGSNILKEIFMRQRPCSALEHVHLLVGCGRAYSMPSNHAANAFAFAVTLWFMLRSRLNPLLLAAAALIGFSRVSVGVHYPSDVLVGALLGTGAAYASLSLFRWAEMIYEKRSYEQALVLVLILISFFRLSLIITGPFNLTPDEAHYWEWSRRPDWSYYSKGPMIAWLISIGTLLFGNTELGIRFFAVVLSALSSVLLFRIGKELYDERTGLSSALLIPVVPLFSVFGMLLTIDSPFIFFWVLSLYFFHRIIRREGNVPLFSWILLGISSGAGLLTKYTMAFFLFSAFLYLIFEKDARKFLKTPGPYLTVIISMLVFSPVIFWNASHGWVTLKHTAGQAHLHEGIVFSLRTFGEFLGSQFGVITPLLFVMSLIALRKVWFTRGGSFLFWFSMPILVFFFLKSIQGKVQANWALTGYITPLVAFSTVYISGWENRSKAVRTATVASVLLALLVTLFAHYPSALRLPDKLDPSTRLAGWKELGKEASVLYKDVSQKSPAFVFSDSYQVASELAFYMDGNPVTYCANAGRRMNQYDLWPGFETLKGQNALFVRAKEKGLPGEVARAFSRCDRQVITVTTIKKKTMKFTIFSCYDFTGFESQQIERF